MIDRRNNWEARQVRVYKKRIASSYEYRKFDMADFAERVAHLDARRDITVNAVWAHYANFKKSLIRQVLEFASRLGVLYKIDEHVYRRNREISSGKMNILKNTPVSSLGNRNVNFKLKNARVNAVAGSIATNSYSFNTDAMRLNLSSDMCDGGHGRKKKKEWNERAALEAGRDRYGLNKEKILDYDLD